MCQYVKWQLLILQVILKSVILATIDSPIMSRYFSYALLLDFCHETIY
jgi:hypothetical protein